MSLGLKPAKKQKILSRFGGKCTYCKHYFNLSKLTVDHLVPASRGGTEAHANLVASCYNCNHLKSGLSVKQFKYLIRGTFLAIMEGDKDVPKDWDCLVNRYMGDKIEFLHEIEAEIEKFSIRC